MDLCAADVIVDVDINLLSIVIDDVFFNNSELGYMIDMWEGSVIGFSDVETCFHVSIFRNTKFKIG